MNKVVWMTETSVYMDSWEKSGDKPSALNVAFDINASLYYGNISAWVWWQGSESSVNDFSLMSGSATGKKYSISKQFYRYIRPGALRVKSTTVDPDFFVTEYQNQAKGTHTIIIINSGNVDKAVYLIGNCLPATFKMYRTNSGTENCLFIQDLSSGTASSFAVPAKSIATLQAGGDVL